MPENTLKTPQLKPKQIIKNYLLETDPVPSLEAIQLMHDKVMQNPDIVLCEHQRALISYESMCIKNLLNNIRNGKRN